MDQTIFQHLSLTFDRANGPSLFPHWGANHHFLISFLTQMPKSFLIIILLEWLVKAILVIKVEVINFMSWWNTIFFSFLESKEVVYRSVWYTRIEKVNEYFIYIFILLWMKINLVILFIVFEWTYKFNIRMIICLYFNVW